MAGRKRGRNTRHTLLARSEHSHNREGPDRDAVDRRDGPSGVAGERIISWSRYDWYSNYGAVDIAHTSHWLLSRAIIHNAQRNWLGLERAMRGSDGEPNPLVTYISVVIIVQAAIRLCLNWKKPLNDR